MLLQKKLMTGATALLAQAPASARWLVVIFVALNLFFLSVQQRNSRKEQVPSCQQTAHALVPSEEEVSTFLEGGSRPLPSVAPGSPVLAASNWAGQANERHAASIRRRFKAACGNHVFRYRVYQGVVYADHNHTEEDILAGQRDAFLEMLLTAIWIYKAFPNVEVAVSFADEPSLCKLDIPVLQYTIIDAKNTRLAAHTGVGNVDGVPFSISKLLTGTHTEPGPSRPAPKFHRGWAINHPGVWDNLALLPGGLRAYQHCLKERSAPMPVEKGVKRTIERGVEAPSKDGKVHREGQPSISSIIWRGSNTGFQRGWPPMTQPAAKILEHTWGAALLNKRMAVCLMARSHPEWMDVGLHELLPEILVGPAENDPYAISDFRELLVKGFVPLDTWGRYALQLSIDGHGTTGRLPVQYMQGSSVVLKMRSPYQDWYDVFFVPGVHYEPFLYDLSDLVSRAEALLARFKKGDPGMAEMAARAADKAAQVFTLTGQLDSLVYAILKAKEACNWDIKEPTGGDWQVLVLERYANGTRWRSPSIKAPWADTIRKSLHRRLSRNFPVEVTA